MANFLTCMSFFWITLFAVDSFKMLNVISNPFSTPSGGLLSLCLTSTKNLLKGGLIQPNFFRCLFQDENMGPSFKIPWHFQGWGLSADWCHLKRTRSDAIYISLYIPIDMGPFSRFSFISSIQNPENVFVISVYWWSRLSKHGIQWIHINR